MSELSDLKVRQKKLQDIILTEKRPFVKEFAQKELTKVSAQIDRFKEPVGAKLERLEAETSDIEGIIQDLDLIKRTASKAAVKQITQADIIKILVWSEDAQKKLKKLEGMI